MNLRLNFTAQKTIATLHAHIGVNNERYMKTVLYLSVISVWDVNQYQAD